MPRWGLRWLLLALLEMLHVAGWSAYYAVTRLVYAGDEGFLYALSAAETLPAAAAGLGALLAERRGYRAAVGLGVAEGAALAAAGLLVDSRPGLWAAAL
ncbi:MAG: hypothetical protein GXO15_05310, partial [Crenarchaeota archaeon]|nr:hypothetical protein [Thermoproteota archaeon]